MDWLTYAWTAIFLMGSVGSMIYSRYLHLYKGNPDSFVEGFGSGDLMLALSFFLMAFGGALSSSLIVKFFSIVLDQLPTLTSPDLSLFTAGLTTIIVVFILTAAWLGTLFIVFSKIFATDHKKIGRILDRNFAEIEKINHENMILGSSTEELGRGYELNDGHCFSWQLGKTKSGQWFILHASWKLKSPENAKTTLDEISDIEARNWLSDQPGNHS